MYLHLFGDAQQGKNWCLAPLLCLAAVTNIAK
jgi:hypothetical protein